MDSKIVAPLGDGIEPYYTCQRCRHELFKQSDLDGHEPNAQKISRRKKLGGVLQTSASVCTSHFIREGACQSLEWLGPMTEVEGKLHCPTPGCGSRIGNYSWTGSQCSCGTWVVPAIQVPMSKVDRKAAFTLQAVYAAAPNVTGGADTEQAGGSTQDDVHAEGNEEGLAEPGGANVSTAQLGETTA